MFAVHGCQQFNFNHCHDLTLEQFRYASIYYFHFFVFWFIHQKFYLLTYLLVTYLLFILISTAVAQAQWRSLIDLYKSTLWSLVTLTYLTTLSLPVDYRPQTTLVSIQLCLALPPLSSSIRTGNMRLIFLFPDLFFKFFLVALFFYSFSVSIAVVIIRK